MTFGGLEYSATFVGQEGDTYIYRIDEWKAGRVTRTVSPAGYPVRSGLQREDGKSTPTYVQLNVGANSTRKSCPNTAEQLISTSHR